MLGSSDPEDASGEEVVPGLREINSSPMVGVKQACKGTGVPRATWYRPSQTRLSPVPVVPLSEKRGQRHSARALRKVKVHGAGAAKTEGKQRFQDCSPPKSTPPLLDEGRFHCPIRPPCTVCWKSVGRRNERGTSPTHPPYQKPELLATQANQL